MGYDLHIFRGEEWSERDDIPTQEWLAAVEGARNLTLTGFVEATTPSGETLRYDDPTLAEWSGHPSGMVRLFDFRRGQVIVKDPDPPTIVRLVQLAAVLGARVQGDDGEFYG